MTSENTTDWIFRLLTKTGDKTTINSVSFWQPGQKQKTSFRDNCSEMRVLSIIIVRKQITQYKRGMSRAMDQVSWRYCLFIWSACVASREGKNASYSECGSFLNANLVAFKMACRVVQPIRWRALKNWMGAFNPSFVLFRDYRFTYNCIRYTIRGSWATYLWAISLD